jgi:hypothetical protein
MCFSVALINNFFYVENELSCVGKAITQKRFFGHLYRSKYIIFESKKILEKFWSCIWYLVLPLKEFFLI